MSIIEAANLSRKLPSGWTRERWTSECGKIRRVLIIRTSWYADVMEGLFTSAIKFLHFSGVPSDAMTLLDVPGSFEIPLAIAKAFKSETPPELVIALGCVIKGETPHFDYICNSVTQALMNLQVEARTPIGFGVLTVDNMEQAKKRLEKGAEAAQAALWMRIV